MPSFDQLWETFYQVVLPPAVLAAALLAACWPAKRRVLVPELGAALGLAAGAALGCWRLDRALLTRWPGPAAWEWLQPWVTLVALGRLASSHASGAVSELLRGALRGMVAAHAGWLLAPAMRCVRSISGPR